MDVFGCHALDLWHHLAHPASLVSKHHGPALRVTPQGGKHWRPREQRETFLPLGRFDSTPCKRHGYVDGAHLVRSSDEHDELGLALFTFHMSCIVL